MKLTVSCCAIRREARGISPRLVPNPWQQKYHAFCVLQLEQKRVLSFEQQRKTTTWSLCTQAVCDDEINALALDFRWLGESLTGAQKMAGDKI
jgi:hypothetical protein